MEGAIQRDIPTGGISIHVQITGQGEPLLLLMGLGASGDKWQRNAEEYKKHYTCIIPDNRGAGRSDKPECDSYSVIDMAEDTVAILDALGYNSVFVNGISMGGAIAMEVAIRYPERVRGLILTSTFPYACNTFKAAINFLRDNRDTVDKRALKRLNQWMTFSSKTQNERPEFLEEMAAEDALIPYPMPDYAYKAQCNACLAHNAADRLNLIKAPTLIAAGECDMFAPLPLAIEMNNAISDSELYVCKDGGHVHEWEYLEQYNRVTLDFLNKHSGV